MTRVPGTQRRVPGTRNSQKPCESRRVPGVPGVPGDAPACACAQFFSRTRTYTFVSRARIGGTPGTPGTNLVPQVIPLFRVPGTDKTNPEQAAMTTARPASPGNLRAEMPTVAGWVDDLRAAFGAESINAAIRAGLDGQPTFYAEENGRAVGTKSKGVGVTLAETVIGPLCATAQTAGARK